MNEENAGMDITFLLCIIHQEALCKSVLQINRVVKAVVKLINYIKGRNELIYFFLFFFFIFNFLFFKPLNCGLGFLW